MRIIAQQAARKSPGRVYHCDPDVAMSEPSGSRSLSPIERAASRLNAAQQRLLYQRWIVRRMVSRDDLYRQRLAARSLKYQPTFSIITCSRRARTAIAAERRQSF